MRCDGARWDERYRSTTHVVARAPEAAERWPEIASLLPTEGRCVDIASGPGSVSLWLAERGLTVTALDASAVAIDLLTAATSATTGRVDLVDARVVDLDEGLPHDLEDLDLVVCQRFRDPALWPAIVERLRTGGYAVITVLSTVDADDPGPFHAPAGELLDAFGNDQRCEMLRHHEGDGLAHIVLRRR